MLQRFGVPKHGEFLHGEPDIESLALHFRAANTVEHGVWQLRLQCIDQVTGQKIARSLARHHGDTKPRGIIG